MADPSASESFVFEVPPLRMRRAIALAVVAFLLLLVLYVFLRAGPIRFLHALKFHPLIWVIVAEFALGIAFFLRLAYPPRKSWQRLSIQNNRIRYIPGGMERFSGEPVHEASIPPQTSEVLFCQKFLEGLYGTYAPDGYRIIMQSADKTVGELEIGFSAHIDAAQLQKIADGITAATGLPVRFIQRLQSSGGVKEIPWTPPAQKTNLKLSAGLMLGFLPFIGGGIVGYFVTQPAHIVFCGLALWLCELLVISTMGKHKWTRRTALRGLTTIFTFGATYGATAVFVFSVLRHR